MIDLDWRGFKTKITDPTPLDAACLVVVAAAIVIILTGLGPKAAELVRWVGEKAIR
jgi:hypothetical protein